MLVGVMRHKEIMMALQTRQIGLTTTVSGVEGGGGAKYQNIERDYLFVQGRRRDFSSIFFWGWGALKDSTRVKTIDLV